MTRTPPPVDRVAASKAAVAARRARAEVKQRIASGAARPLDVLAAAAGEHPAATLRVTQFLRAIPHIGVTKTDRILTELRISPVKRLGGLGKNQRARLEAFLEEWERGSASAPRVVVLAGPTAVGKGTVSKYIREHYPEVHISVSATTRAPRPGEVDGVDYYFFDDAEFDRLIEA
ncbi:MAG: guanylate kinase, partial [Microbacteriaceae bacterium]|nr:guanylate kinase [Microbacteriaceae bacterium]